MIVNKTTNKVLVKHSILANSILKKMFGFIFKSKTDLGIVFIFNIEKKLNFHTWFMRFDLDFIFLDENYKVKSIVRNVKPWKLGITGVGKYVVEVPAGKSRKTKINDKISFI